MHRWRLTVVDISGTLASSLEGIVLADSGAEVIQASHLAQPMRAEAGSRCGGVQEEHELDLSDEATVTRRWPCAPAPTSYESWRTESPKRLGLSYGDMAPGNRAGVLPRSPPSAPGRTPQLKG